MKYPTVDMWIGTNGEYRVPEAISKLGKLANTRLCLPLADHDWRDAEKWFNSPYFKIVQEWGTWRDAQPSDT